MTKSTFSKTNEAYLNELEIIHDKEYWSSSTSDYAHTELEAAVTKLAKDKILSQEDLKNYADLRRQIRIQLDQAYEAGKLILQNQEVTQAQFKLISDSLSAPIKILENMQKLVKMDFYQPNAKNIESNPDLKENLIQIQASINNLEIHSNQLEKEFVDSPLSKSIGKVVGLLGKLVGIVSTAVNGYLRALKEKIEDKKSTGDKVSQQFQLFQSTFVGKQKSGTKPTINTKEKESDIEQEMTDFKKPPSK